MPFKLQKDSRIWGTSSYTDFPYLSRFFMDFQQCPSAVVFHCQYFHPSKLPERGGGTINCERRWTERPLQGGWGGAGRRRLEGWARAQEMVSGKSPVLTQKKVLHMNGFGLLEWYALERNTGQTDGYTCQSD